MDRLTMSVSDLAQEMGISKPKAYELVKCQGFPVLYVGRRIVIPVEGFKR